MAQSQFDAPLDEQKGGAHDKHFYNSTAVNPNDGMAPRDMALTAPVGDDPSDPTDMTGITLTEDDGTPIDPDAMDPNDPLYALAQRNRDDAPTDDLTRLPFEENLAEHMDDDDLNELGDELLELIESDLMARKQWAEQLKCAIKELGLKMEQKTEPWVGAAAVTHSMLLETVIRFQAEAVQETFNSNGPSKPVLTGTEGPGVADAAQRVSADINALMTGGIPGFRTEHERMLFTLGLCGVAAKQVEFDPVKLTLHDRCIPANDLIMPWDTSHLSQTERYAVRLRLTPLQYERYEASGFYRELPGEAEDKTDDTSSGSPNDELDDEIMRVVGFDYTADDDGRIVVYQVDVERTIEEYEDKPYPWLVTVRAGDGKVLSVYRNWREDDASCSRRTHAAKYGLIPAFGAYDLGYAHLLLSSNVSATDILRNLIDAGSLANMPAGFKTKGMRIKGDNTPLAPGELRDVDVPSGVLRDNIVTNLFKEPSSTLYNLLGTVVEEGRRLGAVADLKVADVNQNAPVGTTLAIMERGLKPMNAIQGRMYDALGDEINLLRQALMDYGSELAKGPLAKYLTAQPQDYQMAAQVRIVPTIDPVSGTMTQRIAQFQSAYQLSQGAPDIYDRPLLHRQMLKVLGVPNSDQLIPDKSIQAPMDPVAENMAIINGSPVQAFEQQDHEGHIAVHMAAKNDPLLQQMVGQSPQANVIAGAMDAHLRQHVAYAYKKRLETTLGQPLPAAQSQQLDQLTPAIAQAADKLLQHDMQQSAAQAAQANAQDPVLQAQAQKQANDARELDIKEAKNKDDAIIALMNVLVNYDKVDKADTSQKLNAIIDAFTQHRSLDIQQQQADTARQPTRE